MKFTKLVTNILQVFSTALILTCIHLMKDSVGLLLFGIIVASFEHLMTAVPRLSLLSLFNTSLWCMSYISVTNGAAELDFW